MSGIRNDTGIRLDSGQKHAGMTVAPQPSTLLKSWKRTSAYNRFERSTVFHTSGFAGGM
ncbi:MAG: hypothetical protein ACLQVJ_17720 [Syntrophobacteraceae bacterium]